MSTPQDPLKETADLEEDLHRFLREHGFHLHNRNKALTLDELIEWVRENVLPENVFSRGDLAQWASENDYMQERQTGRLYC